MKIYLLHKIKLSNLFVIFKHGDLLVTFVFILQMGKWKEIPQGVILTYKLSWKNYVTMQSEPVLSQLDPPPPRLIYSRLFQYTTTTHCRFYSEQHWATHLAVCSIGGALLMTFQYYKLPIRIRDST